MICSGYSRALVVFSIFDLKRLQTADSAYESWSLIFWSININLSTYIPVRVKCSSTDSSCLASLLRPLRACGYTAVGDALVANYSVRDTEALASRNFLDT